MDKDLRGKDLSGADLCNADLREANLSGADLSGAKLSQAILINASLHEANLHMADLHLASLHCADLSWACLANTNLFMATLSNADLSDATLIAADLSNADLSNADLSKAGLMAADLQGADLRGTDFSHAAVHGTTFANVDLSSAVGLETVEHHGPSTIGVDTLFASRGRIPEKFLLGCGVPQQLIDYLPSLIGSMEAIQFYSCFISYSTPDEAFASRLHNDFQAAGIRCWKWDHDARTGRSLWSEIDQAIRSHDKLVLIASERSLQSSAVNREVERAIRQEDERGDDVLFPVRLDEYIFKGWEHERKVDVTKKVIADARGWDTDNSIYEDVRDRLIHHLKAHRVST